MQPGDDFGPRRWVEHPGLGRNPAQRLTVVVTDVDVLGRPLELASPHLAGIERTASQELCTGPLTQAAPAHHAGELLTLPLTL